MSSGKDFEVAPGLKPKPGSGYSYFACKYEHITEWQGANSLAGQILHESNRGYALPEPVLQPGLGSGSWILLHSTGLLESGLSPLVVNTG